MTGTNGKQGGAVNTAIAAVPAVPPRRAGFFHVNSVQTGSPQVFTSQTTQSNLENSQVVPDSEAANLPPHEDDPEEQTSRQMP